MNLNNLHWLLFLLMQNESKRKFVGSQMRQGWQNCWIVINEASGPMCVQLFAAVVFFQLCGGKYLSRLVVAAFVVVNMSQQLWKCWRESVAKFSTVSLPYKQSFYQPRVANSLPPLTICVRKFPKLALNVVLFICHLAHKVLLKIQILRLSF